jgi:hypothetical protein
MVECKNQIVMRKNALQLKCIQSIKMSSSGDSVIAVAH